MSWLRLECQRVSPYSLRQQSTNWIPFFLHLTTGPCTGPHYTNSGANPHASPAPQNSSVPSNPSPSPGFDTAKSNSTANPNKSGKYMSIACAAISSHTRMHTPHLNLCFALVSHTVIIDDESALDLRSTSHSQSSKSSISTPPMPTVSAFGRPWSTRALSKHTISQPPHFFCSFVARSM